MDSHAKHMESLKTISLLEDTRKEMKRAARKRDFEVAHDLEDASWGTALEAIVKCSNDPDSVLIAAEALKTRKTRFPRDCA